MTAKNDAVIAESTDEPVLSVVLGLAAAPKSTREEAGIGDLVCRLHYLSTLLNVASIANGREKTSVGSLLTALEVFSLETELLAQQIERDEINHHAQNKETE